MTEQDYTDQAIEGRPPTQDEQLALSVFDDGIKLSVTRLNESINRMITLATAMVAGALAVLKDDICPGWGRVLTAIFFFASLTAAITGSIPYSVNAEREMNAINTTINRTIKWKRTLLWISYAFLLVGFLSAIVGTAWRVAEPTEPISPPPPIPKAF